MEIQRKDVKNLLYSRRLLMMNSSIGFNDGQGRGTWSHCDNHLSLHVILLPHQTKLTL